MLTCIRVVIVTACFWTLVNCQSFPDQPREFRQGLSVFNDLLLFVRKILRKSDFSARALKMQPVVPISSPFPCNLTDGRSKIRPSSVHRLRPGDIDVVGALGDSIMAAHGAIALDMPQVLVADRGHSFSGGGAETWRTVLTLPNILKVYNPNLVGFARGSGYSWSHESQLNIATAFASSVDLLHQAQLLVKRMKSDIHIDFESDWKMVTVLMGANDLCHRLCYENSDDAVDTHRRLMIEMLDFLRDNVPRIFINIVPSPNLARAFFQKLSSPDSCYAINQLECACLLGLQYQDQQPRFDAIMEGYQLVDKEITERHKEDFAVVFQPFTTNLTLPVDERSVSDKQMIDTTFFAPDCFHFSQKLHAVAANSLWNNLLQPVGSKSRDINHRILEEFICTNKLHPYLFTANNSGL